MSTPPLFDRVLKMRQQECAKGEHYLRTASNQHLVDILHEDIVQPFATGCILESNESLVNDLSNRIASIDTTQISADEHLNIKQPYDVILSSLSLHWVTDLPGVLIQARQQLNDGGCFLATMLGGSTLHELRTSITTAETELRNGLSPRVSPMVDVKDAGRLLQRTGYHLPVATSHQLTVRYPDAITLMRELKMMGEQNVLMERSRGLITPRLLAAINEHYLSEFGNDDGTIPATFEMITLTGWKS